MLAKAILLATVASCAAVPLCPAFAQEAPPQTTAPQAAPAEGAQETADAPANPAMEEIIVTGQKRAESLQRVALAATVLSGASLASKGIVRLDDIQTAAPSLSITSAGLTQAVNIRGVGIASGSAAVVNGVATYYDGLFQPPIVTTNSFYDIRAVEVFRGPQGTFVGSNSTGGAIFINSADPKFGTVEGFLGGEAGSFNRYQLQGAINLPLHDTLAVRIAGNYRQRDSFYTQTNPNLPVPGKIDEHGIRVGVNWEPSDNFSWLIKAESGVKDTDGYAYRPMPLTRYAVYRTNDPFRLNYSTGTSNFERAEQISSRMEYVTDGGTTFRSVSGFENKRVNNVYDIDGTSPPTSFAAGTPAAQQPPPNQYQTQFVRQRNWIEEINILSDTAQRVSWIVGGYFQRDLINVRNATYTINPTVNGPVLSPNYSNTLTDNKKTTTGLFAQSTINLTPTLSVDVGGRYSWYTVEATGQITVQPSGALRANLAGRAHDSQFTGKVALNWKPNREHMFYAFVAKGYKSGGIQGNNAGVVTTFAPEKVIDYELGWKGSLLDGRITTQFGGFYYDYTDFQMDALNPNSGATVPINLTDATIKGFEGQVQGHFGDFTLGGGFGYVDSSLASGTAIDQRSYVFDRPGTPLPQCATGVTTGCSDYTGVNAPFKNYVITTAGGPNLYSPKWTWNISADYDIEFGAHRVTPHVTLAHVGSRWTYFGYNPVRDFIPAYTIVNASITFATGRYSFDIWGTNLADKVYVTGQTGINEFYGNPREYGVRAKVTF